MKISCPYCNCSYEITESLLQSPIGNEKLGYGWWLRCFKCHKKWWLKLSEVEFKTNTTLSANKKNKINKIQKLKTKPIKQKKSTWFGYIMVFALVAALAVCAYNKDFFVYYITQKAKQLSKAIAPKLNMENVKYILSNQQNENRQQITVSGKIINNDKQLIKFKGIRIYISNNNKEEIDSWNETINPGFIMPGDSIEFQSSKVIEKTNDSVKVEVSIF